jgi:hypothetical protein
LGGREQEDCTSKPALGKEFIRPYLKKYPTQKRAGGVPQTVEHLPSKCEALYLHRKKEKICITYLANVHGASTMCLAVLGAGDTQMKKTWVLS